MTGTVRHEVPARLTGSYYIPKHSVCVYELSNGILHFSTLCRHEFAGMSATLPDLPWYVLAEHQRVLQGTI